MPAAILVPADLESIQPHSQLGDIVDASFFSVISATESNTKYFDNTSWNLIFGMHLHDKKCLFHWSKAQENVSYKTWYLLR